MEMKTKAALSGWALCAFLAGVSQAESAALSARTNEAGQDAARTENLGANGDPGAAREHGDSIKPAETLLAATSS